LAYNLDSFLVKVYYFYDFEKQYFFKRNLFQIKTERQMFIFGKIGYISANSAMLCFPNNKIPDDEKSFQGFFNLEQN
jgi:hypothetical protein